MTHWAWREGGWRQALLHLCIARGVGTAAQAAETCALVVIPKLSPNGRVVSNAVVRPVARVLCAQNAVRAHLQFGGRSKVPTINPEHIKRFIEMVNETPYLNVLGIELVEVSEGHSLVRANMTRTLQNMFGGVHGGVVATLVDAATYCSMYCSVPEDMGYVSIDLTTSDLHSARDGVLYAEGCLIKAGRSMCVAEAFIRDQGGRLIGHGTSKCMVGPHLQPMSMAVQNMGYPPMPPKFVD